VPEKSAGQKEKLLPPASFSAIRFIGHRQNMLRYGFGYPIKHRLLSQPLDMEALAILEAARRVRNCGLTTLPTHHKGFGSKMIVLCVQLIFLIHLSIRG